MDPSRNNMPLQFNTDKNKPPMPVTRSRPAGDMKEDSRRSKSSSSHGDHHGGGSKNKNNNSNHNHNHNSNHNPNPNPNSNANNNNNNNMMGMVSMGNMMGPMVEPMGSNPHMMMMNPMFGNMAAGQMQGPMMGGQMGGAGLMGAVPQNMMGNPQGMMGAGPGAMMGQPGGQQGLMGAGPGGPQGMMGPSPMLPGGPQGMTMIEPNVAPKKEVISLKSCILHPPPSGVPPRSMREKPAGCKTIFVGGLPEKCTEEILVEIFEICGPIDRIRTNNKKKFTHIRFHNMEAVEEAMFISGYKMKINGSDEADSTGRIHINYAEDREDLFEWECLQRALAREARHKKRVEEQQKRSPSPLPVIHFSEHEAMSLLEKMKSVENFSKSSQLLITWLERGECNRRTANTFYALVQNAQGSLRHVTTEMQNLTIELEQYKIQHQSKLNGMISQICQVERVLTSSQKQRNWDHFSKAQRKNIISWQRQAKDLRESHETFERDDNLANDDMDLSDDDMDQKPSTSSSAKKRKSGTDGEDTAAKAAQNVILMEENGRLKTQVEAFKNEVETLKQGGRTSNEDKDKQITSLQNALQGMQQQLISQRASVSTLTQEKEDLEKKLTTLRISHAAASAVAAAAKSSESKDGGAGGADAPKEEGAVGSSDLSLSEKEAKMIGLICCFLNVHPDGASVDYLWSYLSQLMVVRVREVEDLMDKIPSMFQQTIVGMGAHIERKWTFTALSASASAASNSDK